MIESFFKKVATFNCQGSQTGQEVKSDLLFYVIPFACLAVFEQNLNGNIKSKGCNFHFIIRSLCIGGTVSLSILLRNRLWKVLSYGFIVSDSSLLLSGYFFPRESMI
jgi:hypothetical protein